MNQLSLMCALHFRTPSGPSISRHNVGLFPGAVFEISMEEFLLQIATGVRLPAIIRNEQNLPRMFFVAIPDLTASDQSNGFSIGILARGVHRNHNLFSCLKFHNVTVRSIPNFARTNEVSINVKGISVVTRHGDAETIDSPFCLDDFAEWTNWEGMAWLPVRHLFGPNPIRFAHVKVMVV